MEFNKEKIKYKIAISKVKEEVDIAVKNKTKNSLKTIITVLTTLGISTSVVFASTVVYNNIWKNKGINKAIEAGYVQNINSEYNIQNNLGIKIDKIIIDDSNIGIIFNYQLSEKLKNIKEITINDLIITDEKENIIFEDGNEKSLSTGYSNELTIENNIIKQYILFENLNHTYPKSQNINIEFKNITFKIKKDKDIIYTGNWKFDIPVDNKLVDREKITYESSEIEDIKIIKAELTSTGLNIEIKFNFPVNAENLINNIKIQDKERNEYFVSSMNATDELEKTTIKMNFSITKYDIQENLYLFINLDKEYKLELFRN